MPGSLLCYEIYSITTIAESVSSYPDADKIDHLNPHIIEPPERHPRYSDNVT